MPTLLRFLGNTEAWELVDRVLVQTYLDNGWQVLLCNYRDIRPTTELSLSASRASASPFAPRWEEGEEESEQGDGKDGAGGVGCLSVGSLSVSLLRSLASVTASVTASCLPPRSFIFNLLRYTCLIC